MSQDICNKELTCHACRCCEVQARQKETLVTLPPCCKANWEYLTSWSIKWVNAENDPLEMFIILVSFTNLSALEISFIWELPGKDALTILGFDMPLPHEN